MAVPAQRGENGFVFATFLACQSFTYGGGNCVGGSGAGTIPSLRANLIALQNTRVAAQQ